MCPTPAVNERLAELFRRLLAGGLTEVSGAEGSITLPVSKRLLNDLIVAALPPSAPVRDLDITPLDGDRFLVRGRIGSSALLPALQLHLVIDRQPEFPDFPVVVFRMETSGIMSRASRALQLFSLPRWIHVEQNRVQVDLRALADQHRVDHYVSYLDQLRVHTVEGTVIVSVRARVK